MKLRVLTAVFLLAICVESAESQASPTQEMSPPSLPEELMATLLRVGPSPDVSPKSSSPELSSDLQTLSQWLEGASLVGLGESTHGTDDYHRLLHRIFAHLVREEGFDVIALEISQAHATRLNDFVHGRRNDLDELLAERWWVAKVFYDDALRDLLLWMRAFVEAGGRPIHIAGYDFKQPSFAIAEVIQLLQPLDTEAASKAAALYATIDSLGGLGVFPNVSGLTAETTLDLPASDATRAAKISLWVRGVGVEHGSVGLLVRGRGRESGFLNVSQAASPADLSDMWTRLEIEVEVAADLTQLSVGFYHRGNGSVWYDELSVEVAGELLVTEGKLEGVVPWPLLIPLVQVMDYQLVIDRDIVRTGSSSVRIDCSAAIDRVLAAIRQASALVDDVLAAKHQGPLEEKALARQLARLVEQSVEWRTLIDNNRDVALAENVTWLQREGYPGRQMLVFGHTSHIERIPERMGGYLAKTHGNRYKTISMLALAGDYVYFGDPGTVKPDSALESFTIDPQQHVGQLERDLASFASGKNLLFHLSAAPETIEGQRWLESVREHSPGRTLRDTDVVVLLQRVSPLIPLASDR